MASGHSPLPPTTHYGAPGHAAHPSHSATVFKIVPLVFLSSITRNLFPQQQLYNNLVCHDVHAFSEDAPIGCGKSMSQEVEGRTAILLAVTFLIQVLTAPYWSHWGDVKGRPFALAIPIIGNLGAGALSLVGLMLSPGISLSFVFVVLTILATTLSGGWVTFYGAVLAYTAEVSSHAKLLGRLTLLAAVQWIGEAIGTLVNNRLTVHVDTKIYILPLIGFLIEAFELAYIRFLVKDSRHLTVRLPDEEQDSKTFPPYRPGVWLKEISTILKQSRSLLLTVAIIFLAVLARVISEPLYFYSFLKTEDGSSAHLVGVFLGVKQLVELVLLIVTAAVSSIFLDHANINIAASVKYLSLGSISNTGWTHILVILALALHLVVFVFVVGIISVFSFALVPALVVLGSILFEHEVEGHASERGSLYGGVALVATGATIIGYLIDIWSKAIILPGHDQGSTLPIYVLDAIVVVLSASAAGLLMWVKVPGSDVQHHDEDADDRRALLNGGTD